MPFALDQTKQPAAEMLLNGASHAPHGPAAEKQEAMGLAQHGTEGPTGAFPHQGAIQQAFGPFSLSHTRSVIGGPAQRSNEALGTQAYSADGKAAFSSAPDLRTAAHEAAHVMQHQAGKTPGGFGQAGDAHERHADAVADRVVSGQSATDLLAGMQHLPSGHGGEATAHAFGGFFGKIGSALKGAASSAMSGLKKVGSALANPKKAIYDARLAMKGRKEQVMGDTQDISNLDIVLEQLAHAGAYGNLDNRKLADWGYREAGALDDPESGFRAVLYQPTQEAVEGKTERAKIIRAIHGGPPVPVLAFAGTDPKSKRDISDDVNRKGIGTYQFSTNAHRVQQALALAGGPVISTGHSLGGALAQICAARYPGGVSRVVTFQAPAINADDVKRLEAHNQKAGPDKQIKSTHYRAEGDIVHAAGEKLTPGEVYTFESVGVGWAGDHTKYPLARLAAARGNLIPGIESDDKLVRVNKSDAGEEKKDWKAKVAEWGRKNLLGFLRQDDMEPYIEMWEKVKQMCDSGQFSQAYVLGVIKSSPKLTENQKIKMRDAALDRFV